MYETFTIEYLRGFKHLTLDKLTTINLISGRNNTGKTALLEALFLHAAGAHAGEFALTALTPIRTGAAPALDPTGNTDPWTPFFLNQDPYNTIKLAGDPHRDTVTLEISIPPSRRPRNILSYAQPGQASPTYSLDVSVQRDNKNKRDYLQTVGAKAVSPATPLLGNVALQFAGLDFKLDPPAEVLVPAVISTARSRAPQQELARRYSNLKMQGREGDFLAAMRVIEPRLQSIEVLVANGQPTLHVDIGIGPPLPLQLLGEGSVTLADIISAMFEVRNGVVLIDEIENGVHYSILPELWFHLGRAARQAKVQVFATTHSRECVVAAHTTFRKTPHFLSLVRLATETDTQSAESVVRYDSSTLEAALDLDLDIR
jgi:putative AbiEii toxin of type IV toxin-antitoxin system